MASYTMQLREYIEKWSQWDTNPTTRNVIEKGRTKLFDFDYPIFDPAYKKVFETHFIRKFYMREIGFETEGLFKFNLETWLIINMPYFNKLFESELIEFDPLVNTMTEVNSKKSNDKNATQSSSTNGKSSGSSSQTSDGFARHLESDNPDTRLNITTNDGEGVIEYATSIEENNTNAKGTASTTESGSSSSKGDSTINETEDYIQVVMGKNGDKSFSRMVNEYRDSFIRIENKIFDEMQELFMLVY